MADAATIQQRLDEAEAALHRLMTCSSVEEISSPNGDRVKYTAGTAPQLRLYIADLKSQTTRRRPIFFEFGR